MNRALIFFQATAAFFFLHGCVDWAVAFPLAVFGLVTVEEPFSGTGISRFAWDRETCVVSSFFTYKHGHPSVMRNVNPGSGLFYSFSPFILRPGGDRFVSFSPSLGA